MDAQLAATVKVGFNKYLPLGGSVLNAIVTVTLDAGAARPARPRSADGDLTQQRPGGAWAAEVIMIDCSGSMFGRRLEAAKAAACVAVDTLPDGVELAIIAGNHEARMIFPAQPGTVILDQHTKSQAKQAVRRLHAMGGTTMSTWLDRARQCLPDTPGQLRHAILLTDGENGEPAAQLERALEACRGQFVCDSRGVGRDWKAEPLIQVAQALLGTAAAMRDPAELPADFLAIIEQSMSKVTSELTLRVWTPLGCRISMFKQMNPEMIDLTAQGVESGPRHTEYPLGTWGTESRDYHLRVSLVADEADDEMAAARIEVLHRKRPLDQRLVVVKWTDDLAKSTVINRQVAHYSGQAELADAIQEGLDAQAAGDLPLATARLGQAVRLANQHGRTETVKLLAKVVDVLDPGAGTVRLRSPKQDPDLDLDGELLKLTTRRTQRLIPKTPTEEGDSL